MSYPIDIKVLASLEPIFAFCALRFRALLAYCQSENNCVGADIVAQHGFTGQSVSLVRGQM